MVTDLTKETALTTSFRAKTEALARYRVELERKTVLAVNRN
jgi:hypothetical protein